MLDDMSGVAAEFGSSSETRPIVPLASCTMTLFVLCLGSVWTCVESFLAGETPR